MQNNNNTRTQQAKGILCAKRALMAPKRSSIGALEVRLAVAHRKENQIHLYTAALGSPKPPGDHLTD